MRKRVVSASNPYFTLDYLDDPTGANQDQPPDDNARLSIAPKKTFKFQVRELKEETGSFFTLKFDAWKEFVSKPRTLEEYVTFNRSLERFEAELEASPDGLRIERKLLRAIQRINEGIFDWREQYRQVKRFTSVYAMFRPLKDWATCTFVNIEPVRDRLLPYKLFEPFFRTPFYSDDPNHFYASAVASFFTNLFWAFLRLYVSCPCATYPRIDDELFSLMDPFSREKIRTLNRGRYRAEVEERQGFFILKLTNMVIEKFLTTEAIRWGRGSHTNATLPILTLVNELLMFGLVDHVELQQLMTNMHLISETLAFIEKSVSPSGLTDEKKSALFTQGEGEEAADEETRTNSRELGRCKLLISQIVLQAIFVYSDHGFVSFCKKNQHRPYSLDRHEATRGRLQNNKSLYKSICLILLRYLLTKNDLPVDEEVESQLEVNRSLLLIFLTDSKRNYFMESLELVHEEHAGRYMNEAEPSVAERTARALEIRDELIAMVRKPSKYFKLQSVLDKVGRLCEAIPDGVKGAGGQSAETGLDVPFTLELCWTGLTRFVLLLTERINFGQDDKVYLNPIFDLLRRLMQHNHPAQSLLFRGSTFLSYAKIFLDHKFRSMRLLIEVFESDFLLLNQSHQVFDIKMSFYDHLIKQYQKGSKSRLSTVELDRRSKDDQNFYVSVSSLLLFNIFLEKIILMNIRTSREKWRKYDLVLQIKIVNLIANEVLPALLNPNYLSAEEQRQVDLGRICRFEFTKEKAIELRETIEKSNKRVALYSLFFTFLRIFVISTTYAFPKVVYAKIRAALLRYDAERVFSGSSSNIMLRAELLKLVERFWVFPNNHILYEGLNAADHISFARPLIPPNFLKIHKTLECELKWVMRVEVDFEDPYDERREMIKEYLRGALLPAIYKMVKGIQSAFSILEKPSVISNLRYYLEQLVSMLEFRERKERMLTILEIAPEGSEERGRQSPGKEGGGLRRRETDRLLFGKSEAGGSLRHSRLPSEDELVRLGTLGAGPARTSESEDVRAGRNGPPLRKSMTVIRGLQGRARKSQIFIDPSVEPKLTVDAKIGSEVFEERLNSELRKVRKHAAHIVAVVESLYRKASQTDAPLANFKETSREWMFEQFKPKKELRTSETKRLEYQRMMEDARRDGLTVIAVVRQLYRLKDFKHHSDKNPLIRLLTADSHHRQYNYNVARATISILANMSSGDSDETQKRCFFIKELYADQLRVVNYLMNYSADLRVQMYGLLRESSEAGDSQLKQHLRNVAGEPISKGFMRGVWAVYVNLTLFLYYKTFDDKYLRYHAELHLLVSEFLRNLFMNNFNKFKLYLAECPFGVTKPGKYQFRLEKDRVNLNMLSEELMSGRHQEEQLNDIAVPEGSSVERPVLSEEESGEEAEESGSSGGQRDSGSNTPEEARALEAERRAEGELLDLSAKSGSVRISEGPLSRVKQSPASLPKGSSRERSSSDNTPDQVESIFIENFALMAELFDKCTVARDVAQTCIVPSDRSDLFAILVQVMTNLTEFVTGPCVPNQLRIYDKQTYIWNGILNRYVEDIDDNFYHVKLAVLEYIMGMIQGFNHAIIDFMSQQLQVGTIFDLTITLTRLLYLRFATGRLPSELSSHDTLNDLERVRAERAARYANYDRRNHFESLEQGAGSGYAIRSPEEIYHLYRTNRDFNSHLIMQIIVHTYVFMRSIGDKIKFWQIYLKEKEDDAANWEKVHFNREANVIFKFVLEMMFSIEIVYEINDEALDGEPVGDFAGIVGPEPAEPSQEPQNRSLEVSYSKDASRFGSGQRKTPQAGSRSRSRIVGAARVSEAISEMKLLALNQANEMQPVFEASGPRKRVQRRFYFQTPPTTLSWTASMKERVIRSFPVKSTNRKQVYLYARLKQLTIEAELHSERHKSWGVLAYLITPDAFDLYEIFLFLFSLAQIMMLMAFMTDKPKHPAFIYDPGSYHAVQIVWALTLTGLSFLVLVLWMLSRWKIYRIMKEKEAVAVLRRRLTRWEKAKIFIFDSLVFNPTFSSFLMNFIITLLGFFVYTGIYTLNLFLAIKIFKPMSDVFVSIISSGMQLISTFQLMTLLIYFYSWVMILGLPDRIINDWGGPQNCRDLWSCLMNTWNFGLRDSGGLGESLKMIQEPSEARFWLGWVVALTYLILIKFIMLNIVAGIIIEGFGELREKNNQREFDVLNYCPICGMDRWKSESVGVPFEEHIGKIHNLWNYLKFLVRLNQLSEKSLVGFEFNIRNQLHYNQTRWFPKNKVLTAEVGYEELDNEDEEESEEEESSE